MTTTWKKYAPGHYVNGHWHACKLYGGEWGLDWQFPLGTSLRTFATLREAQTAGDEAIAFRSRLLHTQAYSSRVS